MLNGTGGGQETKLTRRESDLVTACAKDGRTGVYHPADAGDDWASRTMPFIKLLHGYRSRETLYSGLLDKCPGDQLHRPDGDHR